MEGGGGGGVRIDLDKLPIKRLEAIDEIGNEQFPPDTSSEEQRLATIRRIDFSWLVERDAKKAKKSDGKEPPQQAWPWQSLRENLQQAHQELTVIIDLINTVEANDAVAVAGMQRPKPLPNEALADLAVSAATKLQRLRHLGRYFKQSSRTMEQQVQKEARFYGSLIRLQQNWKVKRHRLGGSEGFTFDLVDNSQSDSTAMSRSSSLSLVLIDQDESGTLAIQVPPKSCRSLCLQFRGDNSSCINIGENKEGISSVNSTAPGKDALKDDDVNKCIRHTHSVIRKIHKSIFEEQVFDMVNRETFIQSQGINVTGMREDFLQLAIGQQCSLCLSLVHSGGEDNSEMVGHTGHDNPEDAETANLMLASASGKHGLFKKNMSGLPNPVSSQIYLLHIFHGNFIKKGKERYPNASRSQISAEPTAADCTLLGHFCMTVAHRMLSNKVHLELESLIGRVPYLHLRFLPTWHSRISSWSLSLKVPQPILAANRLTKPSDNHEWKYTTRSQFNTKVVLKDDQISLMGEGSPSIAGSLAGKPSDLCLVNSYSCDLEDLPMILLQQVASQVIHWLHEEALVLGMNVTRDFLCLYFDLDQGEILGLVAHVDPEDACGCISWHLTVDRPTEDGKLSADNSDVENHRFLGYLSLEALYSTLMDLVNLCSIGVSH